MDLDFDLYATLSSDQNPFVSNPESPFLLSHASPSQNSCLISSFEQPFSPLWIFSDVDEEMSAGNANSAFAGDLRFAECPKFLSCNPNTVTGNLERGEEKSKLLPEATGLALQENSDGSYVIKERMMQALRSLKDSADQHVLAQVWAPVKNGDRYVLTTSGQPFVLDPNSTRLLQYRTVSLMYMFSVDGESEGDLGLPGRVFRQKLPEWTPNVQYYSSKEYPRLYHALHYNVQGTLALPVFETSGKSCVGVLELILTSQKINYAPEVDKVCKALEAVNLQSSGILDHPNTQICNEGRQNALAEILEVLSVVCETHKLPLAQTWVPCMHRTILTHGGGVKKSCTSFDGSCMGKICMSTTVAFYVIDSQMWGFRDACAEHHLQKGQGVAGKAFSSHKSCFCRDITRFSKTEYPLVHYARVFGLTSCFAICLRSNHTGSDDYILEFFLPPSITESKEQEALLDSLFMTMKQHFRSLMVASGEEFEEEKKSIEIIEISIDEKIDLETKSPQNHDGEMIMPDSLGQQYLEETDALKNGDNLVCADGSPNLVSSFDTKGMRKTIERRRGKTEKSISLEILQQYFAGSLKDAAKSLGVCPTTMKRICRQHGISRWPSRKINKVNRSLSKLKRVIESVQGAEGAFGLTSLTTSPLPVAAGSIYWPVSLGGPNRPPTPCSMPPGSQDGKERDSRIHNTLPSNGNCEIKEQMLEGGLLIDPEVINEDSGSHPGSEKGLDGLQSKTSSGDESAEIPASHGSCQGSPAKEGIPLSQPPFVSLLQEQGAFQPTGEVNLSPLYSISNALITTQQEETLCGMLIEDAGSSKDLQNLCNPTTEGYHDERLPITHDPRTVTIKATYRDDIIRFRLSLSSSVVELKEEVAKRLKLEVGTFDIKYLDDDHEWVILVCDADLQECMDISRSSVRNMIRLSVHDVISNLGSSCESSG